MISDPQFLSLFWIQNTVLYQKGMKMLNFGGQTCWWTNSRRFNRYKIRYQNVASWFKVNFGISWFLAPSKPDFTFLIWNRHWTCRFQSKFNHLSVIKACERPWNCNFSNSDSTSDLDNDRSPLVHGYNEPELEFCDLEKNINRKFDIIEGASWRELVDTLSSRVQIKYDIEKSWHNLNITNLSEVLSRTVRVVDRAVRPGPCRRSLTVAKFLRLKE